MDCYGSDSDEEFEVCPIRSNSYALPFDPTSLENIILTICDNFDFRLVLSSDRAKGALIVTTGLTFAGGMLGRYYGGRVGAMVGGAVGGVCGLGIVAVSMRDVWEDIKAKLAELFDIVYDYLAGMGIDDYKKAITFLNQHRGSNVELALIIAETASSILGNKVLSSLSAS